MEFPILAIAGAGIGFFFGDKEDSTRNALIGAAAGFALSYFSKSASALSPGGSNTPVDSNEQLPTDEQGNEIPTESENATQNVENAGEPGAVLVGNDYFPIGAYMNLSSPYRTYAGRAITMLRKMPNGNWLTQPGQDEYFTSCRKVVERGINVFNILDSSGQLLWSQDMAQTSPLAAYAV